MIAMADRNSRRSMFWLTSFELKRIQQLYAEGKSSREIERLVGVSKSHVCRLAKIHDFARPSKKNAVPNAEQQLPREHACDVKSSK